MEKIRYISLKDRRIGIAGSLILASAMLVKGGQAEAEIPYQYEPIPQNDFQPLILPIEPRVKEHDLTVPIPKPIVSEPTVEPSLTKEEQKQQEQKKELDAIVSKMKTHNDLFSNKYIRDAKMYYPIYKEIADKFHLDWYLLWIVHEKETGASAGTRGFAPDSYYVGAMQRDPNIWDQDFVNYAAKGLEDLAKLPQRHKEDWKEIAAGAAILDRNIDKYKSRGNDASVHKALLLYSAKGPAEERFKMYKQYEAVFS